MDENEIRRLLQGLNLGADQMDAIVNRMSNTGTRLDRVNRDISSAGAGVVNSIKTTYAGILGVVQRAAKEQVQPFEQGIDVMQAAFGATSSILKGFGDKGVKFENDVKGLGGKLVGALGSLPGAMASLAGTVTDITKDAFTLFADQLIMSYNSFKQVTQSGIVLANGLTDFAALTDKSGVPMRAFTQGLRLARTDLGNLGTGAGEATKKVAGVMGEITAEGSGYYEQLSALGYSTEEQVALVAQQMANDRAAGIVRQGGDKAIAAQTVELAKNMRMLTDLTGQDAKQLQEKARAQSLETDILKKAMQEGGPQAVERTRKMLEVMQTFPADARKGMLEIISSGGQATDLATNVLMSGNESYANAMKLVVDNMKDPSLSPAEAQKSFMEAMAKVGKEAIESQGSVADTISSAARLSGDSQLAAVKSVNDAFIQYGIKIKEGATAQAASSADDLGNLKDKLTKATEETARAGLKFQADIQGTLRLPMDKLAEGVNDVTKVLADGAKKMREVFTGIRMPEVPTKENKPQGMQLPPPPGNKPQGMQLPPPPNENKPQGMQLPPPPGNKPQGMQLPPAPRALGGDVLPNKTYLVGERGPELLAAREMGTIISNDNTKLMAAFKELSTALVSKKTEDTEAKFMPKVDDRSYQAEMLNVMREQIVLMRNNLNISTQMLESMDDIYSVQTRIADSRA